MPDEVPNDHPTNLLTPPNALLTSAWSSVTGSIASLSLVSTPSAPSACFFLRRTAPWPAVASNWRYPPDSRSRRALNARSYSVETPASSARRAAASLAERCEVKVVGVRKVRVEVGETGTVRRQACVVSVQAGQEGQVSTSKQTIDRQGADRSTH